MPTPTPTPKKEEPKIDYSDPKVLDEQIEMATKALRDMEMESSSRLSFLNGNLNALNQIKKGLAVIFRKSDVDQK
jgi:hypothetical protein